MAEFTGRAGTIYTQKSDGDDDRWEVWFEDFCILGTGNSELEALRDAVRHTGDIGAILTDAVKRLEGHLNANPI